MHSTLEHVIRVSGCRHPFYGTLRNWSQVFGSHFAGGYSGIGLWQRYSELPGQPRSPLLDRNLAYGSGQGLAWTSRLSVLSRGRRRLRWSQRMERG